MFENSKLAYDSIQALIRVGVRQFCVCPGARNSPWVVLLSRHSDLLQIFYFFEERSAAFFALGRIRQTGEPVAVVTTSGTAAGELLPATMEAYYAGLPLVLLTADRPRRFRGSGAPQTAEQVGLFGIYAAGSMDIEVGEPLDQDTFVKSVNESLLVSRPFHLNACFEEPLVDPSAEPLRLQINSEIKKDCSDPLDQTLLHSYLNDFFKRCQFPLIIVGMLHPEEREKLAELLLELNAPTYFESTSGLREDPRFESMRVHIPDRIFEKASQANYPLDGIVRFGGIPTVRLWRDLDLKLSNLPVLSLSERPFSGLGRPTYFLTGSLNRLSSTWLHWQGQEQGQESRPIQSQYHDRSRAWLDQDRKHRNQLDELLSSEPFSEPGMVALLSRQIQKHSRIYLGNSMPIREWNLGATWDQNFSEVWASRGLNGIDGQVSTFLGFAEPGRSNWGLLGDLTALYDLPGPWILEQLPRVSVNLVVINNEGGKIFSRMFTQPEFQNRHQLRFSSWAALWGLPYEKWNEVPTQTHLQVNEGVGNRLIELLPDEAATERFWKKYLKILG